MAFVHICIPLACDVEKLSIQRFAQFVKAAPLLPISCPVDDQDQSRFVVILHNSSSFTRLTKFECDLVENAKLGNSAYKNQ